MKKKFATLFLCFSVLLSWYYPILAVVPVTPPVSTLSNSVDLEEKFISDENNIVVWDGSIAESFAGGSGTKDDPYQINTAEQLALLASLTCNNDNYADGKYFLQTADIVLNSQDSFLYDDDGYITGVADDNTVNLWTPIGAHYVGRQFTGNYNGNGYYISGMYVLDKTQQADGGLFISDGAEISNVRNINAYAYGWYTGGISSGDASKITNCIYNGVIYGRYRAGGIASIADYIENCKTFGKIYSLGACEMGGIAGIATTVINCANNAMLDNAPNNSANCMGGIVGNSRKGDSNVMRCINTANIYIRGEYGYENAEFVGGIVGEMGMPTNIMYCYNTGDIYINEKTTQWVYAGGIGGYVEYEGSFIDNCYNIGKINSSIPATIGSLLGNMAGGDIKNSYSSSKAASNLVGKNNTENTTWKNVSFLTDTEMQSASSFVGFDFDTVWEIGVTEGYPYPTLRNNPHSGSFHPAPRLTVTPGTTTEQTQFMFDKSLCNDATSFSLEVYNVAIGAGSLIRMDATHSDVVTMPQSAGTYSAYLYAIYEDGTRVASNEVVYTVTQDESDQKPILSGFKGGLYTLALGDTLTLDGILTAAGDGKLNVVTLKHNETGTTFPPRRMELNGSTNTFNLADFGALTTDEYPLNTVGVHEFIIYASADNYTVTNNAITSFAVQVVEAVPQIISVTYDSPTIVENTDVTYTIKVSGEADKVELWVDSYNVATVSDYLTSGSYRIFTSDVSIQNPGTRMFKAIAYDGTVASEPYTMEIVVEEAALPELSSVTIMQPTNGSVLIEGDSLLAKWSTPANVSSVDKYIVKVWSDVSKKYTYINNITQNSVNIGSYYLQDVGSYSISVTAIKSGYEPSEAIAYFDVEEGTKALSKPAISSPSSYGSYDAGKDLTFSWSKVSGATEYYYKVIDITDGEPGTTVLSGTTNKLSAIVPGNILLAGHVICLSVYAWSSTNESEEACAYAVIVKSDVSINVSVEELDFESAADYKTIKLTSSNSWTATASESWITLDKYSGSSDSNIKISVSKNTSDRIRWGFVEFEDSTGSVIVEVYQATSSSAYINVGTDVVRFDAKRGCSDNISITSNVSWKITSDVEWLFASRTSGTYDCEISLVVEANSNTESRTGEITISNGSISETITVIQEGGSSPTISDFMSNYTVELGHDVPLQGVIEAFGNGKLNKVTIKCNNSGGNENTVATIDLKKLNTSTFDLADFKFATTNSNIFSGTGEYTFIIYVSADNFTVTDNSIGSFTVSVTTTQKLPSVVDKGIFDIQATTVTLNAMIDSYGSGTFEKCGFDIYDANGDYIPALSGVALGRPRNNTNTFRRTVSGLTPSTKYYYCPYIKTSEGVFPPKEKRELIEFTTGEAINATTLFASSDSITGNESYILVAGKEYSFSVTPKSGLKNIDPTIKSIQWQAASDKVCFSNDVKTGESVKIKVSDTGDYLLLVSIFNYDGSAVEYEYSLRVISESSEINRSVSIDDHISGVVNHSMELTWNDEYFSGVSNKYNHSLAKASSIFMAAAYNLDATEEFKAIDDPVLRRTYHVRNALEAVGFDMNTYTSYNYENDYEKGVGHSFAMKQAVINGEIYNLIAVIIRGTQGKEWVDNFNVDNEHFDGKEYYPSNIKYHEGFGDASDEVLEHLNKFIQDNRLYDVSKNKIWLTGHSRGAAVANLVAGSITESEQYATKDNIYAYTFATPNGIIAKGNITECDNIFNIINPDDFVTYVALNEWGYYRYGIDLRLPVNRTRNDYSTLHNKMNKYFKKITSKDHVEYIGDAEDDVVTFVNSVYKKASNVRELYTSKTMIEAGSNGENILGGVVGLRNKTLWDAFISLANYLGNGDQSFLGKYVFEFPFLPLRFFVYNEALHGRIFGAHAPATYISWLYSSDSKDLYGNDVCSNLEFACPIDINVYLPNGELVACVVNDQIDDTYDVSMFDIKVVDDVKSITLPFDNEYRIEIIPRAEGNMNVGITDISANGKPIQKQIIKVDSLDETIEYQLKQIMLSDENWYYALIDSNGDVIKTCETHTDDINNIDINTLSIGGGWGYGSVLTPIGEYVTITAVPFENAAFIGWYLGDKLVSTEPIYSFFATQSQTYTAKFTVSNTGNETDGYTVTGTVTSSDSNTASEEDDTITIILANDEHSYTATVTSSGINSTVDYRIENVVAGTYTMTVSKANHVDRNYIVTVVSENVVQDVKICLLGDVTGDGNVNMKDWGRMRSHIVKTNVLTDYALACADVTKDGNVNMKDWGRMRSHIVKTQPLW